MAAEAVMPRLNSTVRVRRTAAALLLLAVLAPGVLIALRVDSPWSADVVIALLTIAAAFSPLASSFARGDFDIFQPAVGGGAMLAALFGYRPLAMIATEHFVELGAEVGFEFRIVALLGLLAALAFALGYHFAWRAPPATPPRERQCDTAQAACVAALFLGIGILLFVGHLNRGPGNMLGTLVLLAAGRSSAIAEIRSSEYLSAAPVLGACAAMILISTRDTTFPYFKRLLLAVACLFPVAAFALLGNRRFIIPSLLIPLVLYYLKLNRRPRWRWVAILGCLGFLVFATIPYARSSGAREQAGGAHLIFAEAFRNPVKPIMDFFTAYDTEMFAAFALQVRAQQSWRDYYFGRAVIGDLLLAPIPSVVFPNKPVTARNKLLIDVVGTPCDPLRGICPDFSAIGTLYQDFWIFGVGFGMFIIGFASARFWRRALASTDPAVLTIAAVWTVFLPIVLRAGLMPSLQWVLYFSLPALGGLWLVTRRPVDEGVRREY